MSSNQGVKHQHNNHNSTTERAISGQRQQRASRRGDQQDGSSRTNVALRANLMNNGALFHPKNASDHLLNGTEDADLLLENQTSAH